MQAREQRAARESLEEEAELPSVDCGQGLLGTVDLPSPTASARRRGGERDKPGRSLLFVLVGDLVFRTRRFGRGACLRISEKAMLREGGRRGEICYKN